MFANGDDRRDEELKKFLDSLSEEESEKLCMDYSKILHCAGFGNPLTILMLNRSIINEGLIRTYPIEKTISYISAYFDLHPKQVMVETSADDNIARIIVYIPSIKDNVQVMIDAMRYCGHHLRSPKVETIKPNTWVWLQFEPLIQKDESRTIRNEENKLYHLTPYCNVGKIKHIGFSPRSKNELFNYPRCVYLLRGSLEDTEIKSIGKNLCAKNSSEWNNGEYALITIDIDKIPNDVEMYLDKNYPHGIFVTKNIEPDVITDVRKINFV